MSDVIVDKQLHRDGFEKIARLIYEAGGVNPSGYGFISGGYGGGIDQDQFFELLYFRGWLDGVNWVDSFLADRIMARLNIMVRELSPDEVTGNEPFINLDPVAVAAETL